ncbi:beta-N-acetylglucosaminidase domain-containing protein, partial [Acinetobacter baumannii]|nr:beta-N-acetylglucosaminidase domain-containing protein [Acinetobacter baumannii]
PCSDNSKQHLIMGGNDTFLHPGVTPGSVQGIVLNPMQQAEANKSALFANADYAWNIWENKAEADRNWEASFKYMDHGTAEDTDSSKALREISKHMINQNMDSRVTVLQESLELAPKLTAYKQKFESETNTKADAEELITEFTKLKDAAAHYK